MGWDKSPNSLLVLTLITPVLLRAEPSVRSSLASSSSEADALDELLQLSDDLHHTLSRVRRSPTADDRESCRDGGTNNAVDTGSRLESLRERMRGYNDAQGASSPISAFYLPMDDAHQSEYVADSDKRIRYISGFAGSAGSLVVTLDAAALWTDGRYFLQGEAELDCNWILMKSQQPGVPTNVEWLSEKLSGGDKVGADPTQMSYDKWTDMEKVLQKAKIELVSVRNLVDEVWEADDEHPRPPAANNPLEVLQIQFSGRSWPDKVADVRRQMDEVADVAVFTALDDIAWLFNLRGTDIAYNPVFFSYAIVAMPRVTLFLRNTDTLLTAEVRAHLGLPASGDCAQNTDCVHVLEYSAFFSELETITGNAAGAVWFSPMSSYKVFETIRVPKHIKTSIIRELKGVKNDAEIAGLRRCHIRDSAALIKFITQLELEVQNGAYWDELTASAELERVRREQEHNRGLSFATISGFGPNGAVIHYRPSNDSKLQITTDGMYLLDSGGQYLDGTTDVTRTFHFGTPTDFQKEAYTRVLMGHINLATAIWPEGLYGHQIDPLARRPLWAAGLDYRHGTGHGIGMYLSVHEGPGRINIGYRPGAYESKLKEGMFFSDEPGYYEDGEFGVRLETIVMVTEADTPHHFDGKYFTFDYFTLVPFERKLINFELLDLEMRLWLNRYNKKVREEVAEKVLKPAGDMRAYDWVMERTEPLPVLRTFNAQAHVTGSALVTSLCALIAAVCLRL